MRIHSPHNIIQLLLIFIITTSLTLPLKGTPQLMKLKDPLPPFTLYKENNEKITEKDLLGKIIVMNFIFTRCGMPMLCPTATQKMVALQKLVNENCLNKEVYFTTISFDPDFDKPAVLKQYAQAFGADLTNYSFLTGDPELIKDLMQKFGVYILSKNGTINHTMRTLIFDKKGNLIHETSKKDWQPEALLKIIQKILK